MRSSLLHLKNDEETFFKDSPFTGLPNAYDKAYCGFKELSLMRFDKKIIQVQGTLAYSEDSIKHFSICKKCAKSFNEKLEEN